MAWPYPERRSRTPWWVAASVTMVLIAAGVAWLVVDTDDKAQVAAIETLPATQPVTITGEPLPAYRQQGSDPWPGKPVPEVSGQSFDGTPVSIAAGRPTLIVFYSHWGQDAEYTLQFLSDYAADRATTLGYDIVIVSTDVKADQPSYPPADRFAEVADPFPFPVLADSDTNEISEAFAQTRIPWLVLIDADGNLIARFAATLDPELMSDLIPSWIAGAPFS